MDTVILIQASLQSDSCEEEVHIDEIILLRELRKYRLIGTTILPSEIERCLHPCEEDRDIFGLEKLDNCPNISLDIFD
jgi:hypothetical protein